MGSDCGSDQTPATAAAGGGGSEDIRQHHRGRASHPVGNNCGAAGRDRSGYAEGGRRIDVPPLRTTRISVPTTFRSILAGDFESARVAPASRRGLEARSPLAEEVEAGRLHDSRRMPALQRRCRRARPAYGGDPEISYRPHRLHQAARGGRHARSLLPRRKPARTGECRHGFARPR